MKGSRFWLAAVAGAIPAFTVFAFFLAVSEWSGGARLALLFAVLAEGGFFAGVFWLERANPRLFRPGAWAVLGVYCLAAIAISFVFLLSAATGILGLVGLHLILAVLTAFILVMMAHSGESELLSAGIQQEPPARKEEEEPALAAEPQAVLQRMFRMRNRAENQVHETELEKLHQAIRYAEPPLSRREEAWLHDKLQNLEAVLASDDIDKDIRVTLKANDILTFFQNRQRENGGARP